MAIVCATNLSPESIEAANVAAGLAGRLGEPLLLLGVLDGEPSTQEGVDSTAAFQRRLEAEGARLSGLAAGMTVRTRLLPNTSAGDVLSDEECRHSRQVVVAAVR
ncbi:universal stress protein, partial [Pyxidicoccus sp. 3LG]